MRFLLFPALCVLAVGCSRSIDLASRYHEDGRAKPVAAVAAMIDTSSFDVPWSLSEEFTSSIVDTLSKNGSIFVVSRDEEPTLLNPFGPDVSWMKEEYSGQEFVVFMELVEHEFMPTKTKTEASDPSHDLNIAVRLRVVDVRGASPKVVLQEIVQEGYFIPKSTLPVDYKFVTWGSREFGKSPMGVAHAQVIRELSSRIHDYILLAKSR